MSDTEPAAHTPVEARGTGGPLGDVTLHVELIRKDTPGTDHQGFNWVSDAPEEDVRTKVEAMAASKGLQVITWRKADTDPPTYYGLIGRL